LNPDGLALGLVSLRATGQHPTLDTVPRWLDSSRGVGYIAVGMHRQDRDLQFTEYGD
jgi:hypothetical protein